MTEDEARRHQAHLCDVWSRTTEHIGVIRQVRGGCAYVGGHPEYGSVWLPLADLGTSCKIKD